MGSIFKTPKMPGKSEEQLAAEAAEKERLAKEAEDEKARQERADKVRRQNLAGSRSTQSEEIQGFTGFRRRQMGTQASMGQSIRS